MSEIDQYVKKSLALVHIANQGKVSGNFSVLEHPGIPRAFHEQVEGCCVRDMQRTLGTVYTISSDIL